MLVTCVLLGWPTLALAGAPALVTTARGAVQVLAGDAAHEAPTPPFVLEDGQKLKLADGALVVVLFEGHATQIEGPASVDQGAFKAQASQPVEGVDVLDEILGRHVSTAPAGASRGGGDVFLVRPVPGSALTALHTVTWRCAACGNEQVTVSNLLTGDKVWSGAAKGSIAYGGPPLGAGAYAVTLGGPDFAFTVIDDSRRTAATRAAEAARTAGAAMNNADEAARTSVEASVWLQAGLPTDALYVIDRARAAHPDDKGLETLQETFERRAGLPP